MEEKEKQRVLLEEQAARRKSLRQSAVINRRRTEILRTEAVVNEKTDITVEGDTAKQTNEC